MIWAKAISALLLAGNLLSFMWILREYVADRQSTQLWIMAVQVVVSAVLLGVIFYQPSRDHRAEFYRRKLEEAKAKKATAAAQQLAALDEDESRV
jgi:hypothetical protein